MAGRILTSDWHAPGESTGLKSPLVRRSLLQRVSASATAFVLSVSAATVGVEQVQTPDSTLNELLCRQMIAAGPEQPRYRGSFKDGLPPSLGPVACAEISPITD